MKRYSALVNSDCLACGEWFCVTAGEYTGVVVCPECGVGNVFNDSLKRSEIQEGKGAQSQVEKTA